MSDYQRILCVVDLSTENRQIVERAADMARRYAAQLFLLHVVEQLPSEVANNIVLPDQEGIEHHLEVAAAEALQRLADDIELPDVATQVVTGSTKHEIINTAKSREIDLIVIGRHGRHGISRLLGSTANAVLHHASCDVLAVHVAD